MLARRIRERLETELGPSVGRLAALFAEHRERIRSRLPDLVARRRWFERMLDGRMEFAFERGGNEAMEAAFVAEVERAADSPAQPAAVALVAASRVPDLYTLRALRAFNEADTIVVGEGVDDAMLEPARRDARRIPAGLDPAALLRSLATPDARIVWVFRPQGADGGLAALEAACSAAGIPVRAIPAVA